MAQRFGGALNLNLHFHALVIDGVYSSQSPLASPIFHEASPLTDQDVVAVTTILHRRILRYLRRLGRLPRDEHDESSQPEPDEPLFAQLCAASVQGRVALGPKSGTAVERMGRRRRDVRPLFLPGELCCDIEQFSLHAKVLIAADDREALERLCRYIARPPIKVERLSLDHAGRVIYGTRKLIALLTDGLVVRKILAHLGLSSEPPLAAGGTRTSPPRPSPHLSRCPGARRAVA